MYTLCEYFEETTAAAVKYMCGLLVVVSLTHSTIYVRYHTTINNIVSSFFMLVEYSDVYWYIKTSTLWNTYSLRAIKIQYEFTHTHTHYICCIPWIFNAHKVLVHSIRLLSESSILIQHHLFLHRIIIHAIFENRTLHTNCIQ